ncbi:MAG: hypothetical protein R3C69_00175 [Geminicoccaceae bacterium]
MTDAPPERSRRARLTLQVDRHEEQGQMVETVDPAIPAAQLGIADERFPRLARKPTALSARRWRSAFGDVEAKGDAADLAEIGGDEAGEGGLDQLGNGAGLGGPARVIWAAACSYADEAVEAADPEILAGDVCHVGGG